MFYVNKLEEMMKDFQEECNEELDEIKDIIIELKDIIKSRSEVDNMKKVDKLNKDIVDCLCDLDEHNIEETISNIEEVIKLYNIDDMNEEELNEYAHDLAIELVNNELRCMCVDECILR